MLRVNTTVVAVVAPTAEDASPLDGVHAANVQIVWPDPPALEPQRTRPGVRS